MSPVRNCKIRAKLGVSNGMKILVASGPSGGHLFPALSFLAALKEKDSAIEGLLVLPKTGIKPGGLPEGVSVKYISITTIKLRPDFKNLLSLVRFLRGSLESLFFLIEFKPDLVVGFGGIATFAVLFFAWIFRIKTLIHEQNVLPGRANRLLAKLADQVAVSFAETKNYLRVRPCRIVFTGNPLRRELKPIEKKEALNYFGFNADKFTLLVMGGSLGSHNINAAVLRSIEHFSFASRLQIIHLCGRNDRALLEEGYAQLKVRAAIFPFFTQMHYAYSAADLAVCRAGATTIAELIKFALPAIIIPYPFAYAHQLKNARILVNAGCAIIENDSNLEQGVLEKDIKILLEDRARTENMRLHYQDFTRPDADNALAQAALSLAAQS